MAQLSVTLEVRLPFWWQPYFWLLAAFQNSGLLEVDPVIAAEFVLRHARWRCFPGGKWEPLHVNAIVTAA
jgi:hypothetical protein